MGFFKMQEEYHPVWFTGLFCIHLIRSVCHLNGNRKVQLTSSISH